MVLWGKIQHYTARIRLFHEILNKAYWIKIEIHYITFLRFIFHLIPLLLVNVFRFDILMVLETHFVLIFPLTYICDWQVYMLSWIERKAAATLFATPPTSTAEEALSHFLEVNNFDLDCVRVLSKILPKELRMYSKIRTWREAF